MWTCIFVKIGTDMCNCVCRSQVLVFKRLREREVASGSRRSRVMVPMKATFGITEAETSATRNVKSRNVNDVVDFCSFIKLFGCGRRAVWCWFTRQMSNANCQAVKRRRQESRHRGSQKVRETRLCSKTFFFLCRRRLRRVRAEYRVALESLKNQPGKIVDNPRFADDDPDTKIYEREPTETIDQEECDFGWTKDNLFNYSVVDAKAMDFES